MPAMFSAYLLVKMIHILGAIVGLGFTMTFPVIMARALGTPGAMPFALRTVAVLARVGTWAFTITIVTGLVMGWLGALDWKALWFAASMVIAFSAMGIAGAVATPTLRKQIELVDQGPEAIPELQRLGMRSRKVGMLLQLHSLTLIGLMIFKPTL